MTETDYPLLTTASATDIAILGDGDMPRHRIAQALLHNAGHLCCCDGAGMRLIETGTMPDAIIGDGDSLPAAFKAAHKDIIHIVREQDDNDLTKAMRYALAHYAAPTGKPTVALLGVTGKREDHTIGNISLINYYAQTFNVNPLLATDYGWFVAMSGRRTFESFRDQQVSIFNLNCSRLSSEGLRWNAYAYQQLWQGTLNASLNTSFTLDGDGAYLVFRTYEPKEEA